MWGVEARTTTDHDHPVHCWDTQRDDWEVKQPARFYFSETARGDHCKTTDW